MKKLSLRSLQKKCDCLLSPIVRKQKPNCLLCGAPTETAHHHVHKSKSNALRYDLDNLINLCNSCHLALHMNESYHASRIAQRKGLEWFARLERKKNVILKTDREWYENHLSRLTKILHD